MSLQAVICDDFACPFHSTVARRSLVTEERKVRELEEIVWLTEVPILVTDSSFHAR